MPNPQVEKYIWLIDTLRQRGRMTRRQLNEQWKKSKFSNGNELCRRTLYNYKNAIAQLFDIEINFDSRTFEYHIDETSKNNGRFTDWLLNSSAVSDALAASRDISDRILLEDIPSARQHLPTVIQALRSSTRLRFDYNNYTRSRPTRGVLLEPYLARIFKQRWYVIGRNVSENRLKTYALDRMSDVTDTAENFVTPEDFDTQNYFKYSFGIVVNRSQPVDIVLRTDHHYAKYLAALPLHPSQQQSVHDFYCLFRYRMQVTEDLVQELLSHGSRIVVEQPRELRVRIREELKKNLDAYDNPPVFNSLVRSANVMPVTDIEKVRKEISTRKTDKR